MKQQLQPGTRSGKLVAIEPTDQKRRGCTLWRCRCDCGKETLQEAYQILGGKVKSCGCARKGRGIKDLTNQRFGRLTAVERLDEKRGSGYLWRCRCDCGKETVVRGTYLTNGTIKSCGCLRRDKLSERALDRRGVRYGKLVALEPTSARQGGGVVWKCQCDCGREVFVRGNYLTTGEITSCGRCFPEEKDRVMRYVDRLVRSGVDTRTILTGLGQI